MNAETILQFVKTLDFVTLLKAAGIIIVGMLLSGTVGRFVFGKRSMLSGAASSAVAVFFMYAVTAVLTSLGVTAVLSYLAPLPFVTFSGSEMTFFTFADAHYTAIATELVNTIILAFLVNLIDGWMPSGEKLFSWLLLRILTVVLAFVLHYIAMWAIVRFLPEGIVTYAPVILLAILLLMLLTGALKVLVGAAIGTVNPLIGALYTFFFANLVGKMITKAVFTAGLLAAVVFLLNKLGVAVLCITAAALIAYIPFAVLLLLVWYLIFKAL